MYQRDSVLRTGSTEAVLGGGAPGGADAYNYVGASEAVLFRQRYDRVDAAGGGSTIVEADANSAGVSTVTGIGAALWNVLGDSAGVSTVNGLAAHVLPSVGSSTGVAAVDGLAVSLSTTVGASSGFADALGVSSAIVGSVGSSDGIATVTGLGVSLSTTVGSSDGIASVAGDSGAVIEAVGTSSGSSTVAGVGEAVGGTPPIPDRPPQQTITGAGGGGQVLHRNAVSQWSQIRAREHRARQEEDDRAVLELIETFLAVMEE